MAVFNKSTGKWVKSVYKQIGTDKPIIYHAGVSLPGAKSSSSNNYTSDDYTPSYTPSYTSSTSRVNS
jgi:hypothetical protein